MKTGAKTSVPSILAHKTRMVTQILLAVLGSTLEPKRLICRRHREFLPRDYHIPPSINGKSRCAGADWRTCDHAESWFLAGKAKNWNWIFWVTILVIGYPSYILVQILVQRVIQIKRMSGHFTHHTLLKRPHKGTILGGDNGNFSWITAAVSDREKAYSSLILHNKVLAETPNLQVNWEGQMSFLVDWDTSIWPLSLLHSIVKHHFGKRKALKYANLFTRFCPVDFSYRSHRIQFIFYLCGKTPLTQKPPEILFPRSVVEQIISTKENTCVIC